MVVLIWDSPLKEEWRNVRAAEVVGAESPNHWGVRVRDRGSIAQIGEYHFPNRKTYQHARVECLRLGGFLEAARHAAMAFGMKGMRAPRKKAKARK